MAKLKWTGPYQDQRAGKYRVFLSGSAWTLSYDGKRISRHDSPAGARRKAGAGARPAAKAPKKRQRRKPCRHGDLRPVFGPHGSPLISLPVGRVCYLCGLRISIGPSNDAPAEAQVEIRAVELALWHTVDGIDEFDLETREMFVDEYNGWNKHHPPIDVASEIYDAQRGGWLAREIATHDDRETRDANAWTWDITRPVAGQYEEHMARERLPPADPIGLADTADGGPARGSDPDVIAEQTSHDVAASVVRHAALDAANAEDQLPPAVVDAMHTPTAADTRG